MELHELVEELKSLLHAGVCNAYPEVSRLGRFGPPFSEIQVSVWEEHGRYLTYRELQDPYSDFLTRIWAQIGKDEELRRRLFSLQEEIKKRQPIWIGLGVGPSPAAPIVSDADFLRGLGIAPMD